MIQTNPTTELLSIPAKVINGIDVLVCGGGPAGVSAAIAASRTGAKTMLLEQQGCLGGVATNCLVGLWLGSYSRDGAYPVVAGIFDEIVNQLAAEGAAIPAEQDVPAGTRHLGYAKWHGRTSPFEFEPCKRVLEQITLKANVEVRYFTSAILPKVEDNRITGVFIHSKSGFEFVKAKTIVDATGGADIAFNAGCPTVKGRDGDGLMSPVTLICRIEGVDSNEFEHYCRQTGDVRFRKKIAKLKERNEWPFPFEEINCCEMPKRGSFFINTLQICGIDGTNTEHLTRGIIESRKQIVELVKLIKQIVPGFANARMIQTAPMIGIRDTRRIVGQYEVAVEDIISGREFKDTIALSGYQWDMADPKKPSLQKMEKTVIDKQYAEIPYRALVPAGIDNLIVAGRSLSCAWDALGIFRIMPTCFAMGQAAGTAAAMTAKDKKTFGEMNVNLLQETLVKNKAILPSNLKEKRSAL